MRFGSKRCIESHLDRECVAGAKFLTNEEAQMVGELNMRHSHATHDLYNRILEGNPPEWTWYVQVGVQSQSTCVLQIQSST